MRSEVVCYLTGPPVGATFRWVRLAGWLSQFMVVIGLTGCAALAPTAPPTSGAILAVGTGHAHFALSGRLSVRDGQRIEIAGIRWERTAVAESLVLSTPLGSTVASLHKAVNGPALLKASDREATAADMESLVQDALGTAVPLRALGWWIQGLNADVVAGTRSDSGRTFNYAGWDINIEEFPLNDRVPVARRLTARKGEVTLRLVIDDWAPRA